MGAASLQYSGFGGFVARIDDGLTVGGIWGSSHPCNNITMQKNRILDEKVKNAAKNKKGKPKRGNTWAKGLAMGEGS
jgi:hypothetical protein